MRKNFVLVAFALMSALIFSSCAQRKYSDVYSCSDLTSLVKKDILDTAEYSDYSETDIKYIFDNDELFDSVSIIYASSSDDIGEIGVLHAIDEDTADELLDEVNEYIDNSVTDKIAFVKNYLPSELSKLENAQARRFGNYVVFTIVDPNISNKIFEKIQNTLSS